MLSPHGTGRPDVRTKKGFWMSFAKTPVITASTRLPCCGTRGRHSCGVSAKETVRVKITAKAYGKRLVPTIRGNLPAQNGTPFSQNGTLFSQTRVLAQSARGTPQNDGKALFNAGWSVIRGVWMRNRGARGRYIERCPQKFLLYVVGVGTGRGLKAMRTR
jgi:hypothetical protein